MASVVDGFLTLLEQLGCSPSGFSIEDDQACLHSECVLTYPEGTTFFSALVGVFLFKEKSVFLQGCLSGVRFEHSVTV